MTLFALISSILVLLILCITAAMQSSGPRGSLAGVYPVTWIMFVMWQV